MPMIFRVWENKSEREKTDDRMDERESRIGVEESGANEGRLQHNSFRPPPPF